MHKEVSSVSIAVQHIHIVEMECLLAVWTPLDATTQVFRNKEVPHVYFRKEAIGKAASSGRPSKLVPSGRR